LKHCYIEHITCGCEIVSSGCRSRPTVTRDPSTLTFRRARGQGGEFALAEAAICLATAPKSNRAYAAFGDGQAAAEKHPAEPVPLHIRNAPTLLMKQLGYGEVYKYAFDSENAYLPQEYLSEALRGQKWYLTTEFGYEKTIKERIDLWEKRQGGSR
jgi:replication-associated recombination protein RarA